MIPGTSTQKRGLPGKIRALCIRNRPIAPRNGYMGRRSCQLQREKHAFRANAAREAPFSCNQRKENTWRANLATAAKAPSTSGTTKPAADGTPTPRPIREQQPNRPTPRRHSQDHCSWQPEATLKSTCHQDDSRKGTNPRSMKQLARQLSTKDPWRKAACASSFDAH